MRRLWKFVFSAIIVAFVMSSAIVLGTIYSREEQLRNSVHASLAWNAGQSVNEMCRLQNALAMSMMQVDTDDVQLRFDIVLNRLSLLKSGEFPQFAQAQPRTAAIVDALDSVVAMLGPLIEGLGKSHDLDKPAIARAHAIITPLVPQLIELAAAANRYTGEQVARDQVALLRLYWFNVGLILCGIALVWFGIARARMLAQAHNAVRRLNEKLQITTSREIAAIQASERQTQTAAMARIKMLSSIAGAFDTHVRGAVTSVLAVSETLRAEAESVRTLAEDAEGSGETVASLTLTTASDMQCVAEAANTLARSIGGLRVELLEVTESAQVAVSTVRSSEQALAKLTASAAQVGTVVTIIDRVASRTNLLALNASIEAARAGRSGAGFAVVANEIKRLASQTRAATSEISHLVDDMRDSLGLMTGAIRRVDAAVDTVNGVTLSISGTMNEQATATGNIAATVKTAAERMHSTAERTNNLVRQIQRTSCSSDVMLAETTVLRESSNDLQSKATSFAGELQSV